MHENKLNFDEIEDEYIDTMIRLAFKQEETLETQEMIVASKRPFTLEEQDAAENVHRRFIEAISAQEKAKKEKTDLCASKIMRHIFCKQQLPLFSFWPLQHPSPSQM